MGQQEKNEHSSQQLSQITAWAERKTRKVAKQRNQLHEIQRVAQTISYQATRGFGKQEDRKAKQKAERRGREKDQSSQESPCEDSLQRLVANQSWGRQIKSEERQDRKTLGHVRLKITDGLIIKK
jgi:hypothetical protein